MNLGTKNMHVLLVISMFFYQPSSVCAAAGNNHWTAHEVLGAIGRAEAAGDRSASKRIALSALRDGAVNGDVQLVQTLIDQETHIQRLSLDWQSYALDLAIAFRHYDVADILIAAGGDVNCCPKGFCDRNMYGASPFQKSIIDVDLKAMLYCIAKNKRCIDYVNTKLAHEDINNLKYNPLIRCIGAPVDVSERTEVLRALLSSCSPNLDDLAIETEDPENELFGKTVEQVIRELGTSDMVAILDRHIASLRKQGDRGMQKELGDKLE